MGVGGGHIWACLHQVLYLSAFLNCKYTYLTIAPMAFISVLHLRKSKETKFHIPVQLQCNSLLPCKVSHLSYISALAQTLDKWFCVYPHTCHIHLRRFKDTRSCSSMSICGKKVIFHLHFLSCILLWEDNALILQDEAINVKTIYTSCGLKTVVRP